MENNEKGRGEFRFSPRPNRANEIDWQPWGPEAFAQAQSLEKPILLAISAVWCHWCHVMDETSYSDQRVIDLVNNEFIPVRVDRDRRPDIDRRYNLGGWPTTAILTVSGDLLTGATYITPGRLRSMLQQVSKFYKEGREDVEREIEDLRRGRQESAVKSATPPAAGLDLAIIENVSNAVIKNFDAKFGGFGSAPKFPHAGALEFALVMHYRTGDNIWRTIIDRTLNGMRNGEIFDWEQGGFFRYATTRSWGEPHYEKMLEDNSRLLRIYLRSYGLSGSNADRFTAEATIRYLDSTLFDASKKVFYGSQDADEAYYKLRGPERTSAEPPFVDPTVYTDWNALAASAYIEAYAVLGESRYREIALGTLAFLWSHCWDGDHGMYHYWDGSPKVRGLLADQVLVGLALVDAYEITGDKADLARAARLVEIMRRDFYDEADGGFFDIASERDREGELRERIKVLDENAVAAQLLTRVADHGQSQAEKDELRVMAGRTLEAFLPTYRNYDVMAAIYGLAADRFQYKPIVVNVVGAARGDETEALLRAGFQLREPAKVLNLIDPAADAARSAELRLPSPPAPGAYLCQAGKCLGPFTTSDEMEKAAKRLRAG